MESKEFLQARERGRPAQKLLAQIIRSWNIPVSEVADGFFQDWDLELPGKTIEVKYDILAEKTGNILLELEALDHSRADVLAIAYGSPIKAFYLLPLEKARAFAHQWPYKKNVGEFNGPAALIKRQIFLERLRPEVIEL